MSLPTVVLEGIPLHALTEADCVQHVIDALDRGEGGWIITPNLDILRQASIDPDVASMLQRADLRVPDGMPLVWASRILGQPFPERVSGSNLITSLSDALARRGRSIFLLGGNPGVAEQAAEVLLREHPGLEVRGTHCPPFGFERDPEAMARIEEEVRRAGADVVFVALGFPKAERLTERVRGAGPDAWWVGVGISFSFLAGDVARAPGWMQRTGLEWVHRLGQEPRRLAKRYLYHGLPYALRLLGASARRRLGSRGPTSE